MAGKINIGHVAMLQDDEDGTGIGGALVEDVSANNYNPVVGNS